MFIKLLNFILIFFLTIVNMLVMLVPLFLLTTPFFVINKDFFIATWLDLSFLFIFITSSLMLCYLLFDFLFGFTAKSLANSSFHHSQNAAVYGYSDIVKSYEVVKKRFNMPNVEFFISPEAVVNAYAIGSFRGKSIIITMGLINAIYKQSSTDSEYIDSIRGVLGHEMSHLVNSDYLPGLLIFANRSANKKISKILRFFFIIVANFLRIVPLVGTFLAKLIINVYNFSDFFIGTFFKFVLMPLYRFLQNTLGRSIEYRCDRDSAYLFGGRVMACSLSKLGKGSYISVFSTHPSTKSRIKKVSSVMPKGGIISANPMGKLVNCFAIVFVVGITFFSAVAIDVTKLHSRYLDDIYNPSKSVILDNYYMLKYKFDSIF